MLTCHVCSLELVLVRTAAKQEHCIPDEDTKYRPGYACAVPKYVYR